jgi:glucan phosphoethanolaminetransferase (alkaline phosphatase superfamily)
LLFLTLVLGYFYPFSQLLSFAMVPRLLLASFVIALPIVWAAFIFSTSYKAQTECPEGAFGANLLGVVVGGSLEYSVNIWGLDALYLVAILLYFASFAFRPDSVAEQKLHYPSST